MLKRLVTTLAAALLLSLGFLFAQKPFREYPALEYTNFPLPPDYQETHDWARARLKYPDITRGAYGRDVYWTMDYPRSDRHLLTGIRRLTRIDARSVEQPVELDGTDDVYNWPVMYAVEVGHWELPDPQAAQLREYLNRGGFLMTDDYHGLEEWDVFMESMQKVFPHADVVDIPDRDPIFHTVYDLDGKFQVPGAQYLETGLTYERGETGKVPHWRGIYDGRGRLIAVFCHNMDLGDAWEHSDNPRYPEKWASLAYRIAVNYYIYDLTH
jgi:hypothetical protein